ncbi:LysR family transcriptional regulator [Salinisphaera sp. Q1T1-3]
MRVFVEVAQRQSFTAAADHLRMSRSSVSNTWLFSSSISQRACSSAPHGG